jgi:SWI/SNF-related matrix-associated actin-dependent regulator of chromatin subfamily D
MAQNYEKLQKIEREFDWLISRKRFEIEDSLRKPNGVLRTLRVKVWNTVSNQPRQQQQSSSSAAASSSEKKLDQTRQSSPGTDEDQPEKDNDQQDKEDENENKDDTGHDDLSKQAAGPGSTAPINFNAGEGVPKWTIHIEGHLIDVS